MEPRAYTRSSCRRALQTWRLIVRFSKRPILPTWTRRYVANVAQKLSSASLETGTDSSNPFRSPNESRLSSFSLESIRFSAQAGVVRVEGPPEIGTVSKN
jgi:hypothetical protein